MNTTRNILAAIALATLLPLAAAGQETRSDDAVAGISWVEDAPAVSGGLVEQRLDQLNKKVRKDLEARIARKEEQETQRLAADSLA